MIEININSPKEQFTRHLHDNFQVLFSAKFGTGKTYFLRRYFEESTQYDAIFINPVNYSVADNHEIFELIKRDILVQLLEKEGLEFEQFDSTKYERFKWWVSNNSQNIFGGVLSSLNALGKTGDENFDALLKATTVVNGFFSKLFPKTDDNSSDDPKTGELKDAVDYAKSFHEKLGSIYEDNFYSQLIRDLVDQLKNTTNSNRKIVLIVDDLDRLDPEHIFRILNILSAHQDHCEEDEEDNYHKFDFDRVILVSDYFNLEGIFHHKYGENVDFSGYIDKFFSTKPFFFDNYNAIIQKIGQIFASIDIADPNPTIVFNRPDTIVTFNIIYIITSLIESKQLTIRQMKKVFSTEYIPDKYELYSGINNSYNYNTSNQGLVAIDFFIWLYGGVQRFLSAVKNANDGSLSGSNKKNFSVRLLILLNLEGHNFSDTPNIHYRSEKAEREFYFSVNTSNDNYLLGSISKMTEPNKTGDVSGKDFSYFRLLEETLEYLASSSLLINGSSN